MSEGISSRSFPIQSLLSARLLLSPQLAEGRVYFLSDMSGVMSLYAMNQHGSMPEPLLPAGLALQDPHIMLGYNYFVLPKLHKILVMIDKDGNENYQPCFIPLEGGIPDPVFGNKYENEQLGCLYCDIKTNIAYFDRDDRKTPEKECLKVDLAALETISLGKSIYGNYFKGCSLDHSVVILADGYTTGDNVLYIWRKEEPERQLLYGIPIEKRTKDQEVKLPNFGTCNFTPDGKGLIFSSNIFNDEGSASYLALDDPANVIQVPISGIKHKGMGELTEIRLVDSNVFLVKYNIDGCSWLYECRLHEHDVLTRLDVERTLCGLPPLDGGMNLGTEFEVQKGSTIPNIGYVLAFTKASSPAQLYLYPSEARSEVPHVLSRERVLGVDQRFLSQGEDASYTSFDRLRISARLYMPSEHLGFKGPRPLVLYVHGGPQSQERPDFTWFSMPLIQFLTLNGYAVFVPNVRGSSGYGLHYMKMIDHDWGGKDVLDHVEGLKMMEKDARIDSSRRAVVGSSYGGYMTLILVSRHPDLWKAGCDMFGPYDLVSLINRLPESWKTFFYLAMGHPDKDREFLQERSPKTYMNNIKCPMIIIQGKNDPRVVEAESRDVVDSLKTKGIDVEYLVFEDEGHDVIKFKNKVVCYTKIVEFFKKYLNP
jgi:esterase/lipase